MLDPAPGCILEEQRPRVTLRISGSPLLAEDQCALPYLSSPPLDYHRVPSHSERPLTTLSTGLRTLLGCPTYAKQHVLML